MIMNISLECLVPYGALVATILSLLFTRNFFLQGGCLGLSVVLAWYYGKVDIEGLGLLAVFGGVGFFFKKAPKEGLLHKILLLGLVIVGVGFYLHKIPGFHNDLVLKEVVLSSHAWPFSMYFNFDKVLAALSLAVALGFHENQVTPWMTYKVVTTILGCIGTILVFSLALGYVAWEPKFPSIFWLWALNNLLMVCFAEEFFFRGFIQKNMTFYTSNKWIPIIVGAILFGISHYGGGPSYILLATIAGLFYGYAYATTGRLLTSMVVHFSLNLTHILLFSYPALRF
jgi:membrane protease YdiL (CAAX protease family)